ncbi:hypothetical protein AA14337_3225 [Acetobacter malorum DSM 14337]|uniref:Uncharacterized protein n=1 Tax=Acetobacter malorum DSM 14337 TaxID=1307910 RepID=A0ABQ0Q0D2_9PROT|nr:hypothetical protein AA14337_3225 [Acetobacter malorum DSM 14337]
MPNVDGTNDGDLATFNPIATFYRTGHTVRDLKEGIFYLCLLRVRGRIPGYLNIEAIPEQS